MVQDLWLTEYCFPVSSEINFPWMLLTLEPHREGSDNGLSSRKYFLNIKSCVNKLILLKTENYSKHSSNTPDLESM